MSQTQTLTRNAVSTPIIVSSFIGIMMGIIFMFGFTALTNRAGAVEGPQASSEVSKEDFAKFAYAFNQGFEARAVSSADGSGACVEVPMPGQGAGVQSGATSWSSHEGSVASATTASMPAGNWGAHGGYGAGKHHAQVKSDDTWSHHDKMAKMVNSYNTYHSVVHNSSSVTNTNSNNVVGSNNSSSTEISVEDAHGVMIGVSNNQETTQENYNHSFNEDSYNTETNTTVINDSFNHEMNVTEDSYNTENTAVNHVEDSYNTETEVSTETNTETNTTNTTTNTTEDSYNETEIELDVDIDDAHPGRGPGPVLSEL